MTTTTAAAKSSLPISRLGLFGALGALVFTAAWIIATFLQDSYSTRREYISALSAQTADRPWVMIGAFVVTGICTVGLGYGLWRVLDGEGRQRVGPILIILGGVSIFFAGVFRNECSSALPACEALIDAGEVSWRHYAHDLIAFAGFLAFIFASLFTGLRVRHLSGWQDLAWPSIVLAPAFALLLILFLGDVVSGWTGVVQRVFITSVLLWLAVLGLRLIDVADV